MHVQSILLAYSHTASTLSTYPPTFGNLKVRALPHRIQLRLSRLPPLHNLLISPKANYSNACRVDRCKQLILCITRVKTIATLIISSISGTSPFAVPFSAISSDIVNSRNTCKFIRKIYFTTQFHTTVTVPKHRQTASLQYDISKLFVVLLTSCGFFNNVKECILQVY